MEICEQENECELSPNVEGRRESSGTGKEANNSTTDHIFQGRLGCSILRLTSSVAITNTPIRAEKSEMDHRRVSLNSQGGEGGKETTELTLDHQSNTSSIVQQHPEARFESA